MNNSLVLVISGAARLTREGSWRRQTSNFAQLSGVESPVMEKYLHWIVESSRLMYSDACRLTSHSMLSHNDAVSRRMRLGEGDLTWKTEGDGVRADISYQAWFVEGNRCP
jgi:hypothetical protein